MYSFVNLTTLPLWMTFNIIRSSQMNKEYRVKSEQFISLSALPFHKEMQLINYQDFTLKILYSFNFILA